MRAAAIDSGGECFIISSIACAISGYVGYACPPGELVVAVHHRMVVLGRVRVRNVQCSGLGSSNITAEYYRLFFECAPVYRYTVIVLFEKWLL